MNKPLEWHAVDELILGPDGDGEAATLEVNENRKYYIYLKVRKKPGQKRYRYILVVRAYDSFANLVHTSPIKYTKERAKSDAEIKARRLLRVLSE